tara:strand:+ start:15989 stop:16720 length:732 start_codon:yes stop_codon:yes gene_type:complete
MLKEKTALITGASRGIGREIALEFARNGCDVILNYQNNESKVLEVEEEIKKLGRKVVSVKADVSKFEEVKNMVEEVKGEFHKVDILVNNAGIIMDKTLKNLAPEEWNQVINVNLTGVYNVTKNFLELIPSEGRIINISSILGITGGYGQTNYSASKAGVIGFTKSLAKELGKKNITVNVIAPGYIETDMTSGIPDEIKMNILKNVPMRRSGLVEDIANAALFLASEKSGYITGEVLNVNGGLN